MKKGYESNVTINRRKYNEEKAAENLKLRILFFKKHKRAPKKSDDKEEQRLYNFYRRINLSNYENIDKELIIENKKIDEYDLAHLDMYKRQKSIDTKRKYISRVIKEYYDFYLKNGRFVSECNLSKEEKNISKAYIGISKFKKYYTKEHIYYINLINAIKKSHKNRNNLLKIKRYINFCETYLRQPCHYYNQDDEDKLRKIENRIIINLEKIDLDDICIPYYLLEQLYNAIDLTKEENKKIKYKDLNELFLCIISYMEKTNSSCYSDKELLLKYGNGMVTSEHAMRIIMQNINYLDDDLIDKYNSFSFVRKKISKNNISE